MSRWTRRQFLKHSAALVGGLSLPWTSVPTRSTSARVTGRVVAGGQGVGGVSVSDGVQVVQTGANGQFQLSTRPGQPFVFITVPSGYALPQNETGTMRFYRRVDLQSEDALDLRFDLAPLDGGDDRHSFLVLADPQTQTPDEMQQFHDTTVPDVQSTVAALGDRPVFGVGCGDIMYDDLSLFPEYERAVKRMGVPFAQVVGNHDLDFDALTDGGSTATFESHFGPRYYSFDRGQVHYVVLDDVFWPGSDGFGSGTDDYVGYLDAPQLEWLTNDLAFVDPDRPVVVFTHIPPLSTAYARNDRGEPSSRGQIVNRQALYDRLDGFDAHVISGHVHEQEHRHVDGRHEHVVGTVCGAWWSGPICYDGTPSGYAVYDVDGTDVRWRYQSTGHDADHQMRLYPRGADPSAPDEVVANVWDADDAWTVVWYENGVRRGPMAQRTGTDPLSEALHRGSDKPAKREWVDPLRTDHLFYAPVGPDVSRVRVEATDRFGRTYAATVDPTTDPATALRTMK